MEVDPWAVVLRHGRWYLLGWSQTSDAQRALRVDRVVSVFTTSLTFEPPKDLDALRTLEEHLSQGWRHEVDVLLRADLDEASRWLPRSLGRLEPVEGGVRLRATTDEPEWYARQARRHPADLRGAGVTRARPGHRGPRRAPREVGGRHRLHPQPRRPPLTRAQRVRHRQRPQVQQPTSTGPRALG